MEQQGWTVKWSDTRKYITFEHGEGRRVRNSNVSATFHMDISKEALEQEFAHNQEEHHEAAGQERISFAEIGEAGETAAFVFKEVSYTAAQYIQQQQEEEQRKSKHR
jgi:hypothetical protein